MRHHVACTSTCTRGTELLHTGARSGAGNGVEAGEVDVRRVCIVGRTTCCARALVEGVRGAQADAPGAHLLERVLESRCCATSMARRCVSQDDFSRQDEIGALFNGSECVGVSAYRFVDLSLPYHRADSYFAAWPQPMLEQIAAASPHVCIGSNLVVAPAWRGAIGPSARERDAAGARGAALHRIERADHGRHHAQRSAHERL